MGENLKPNCNISFLLPEIKLASKLHAGQIPLPDMMRKVNYFANTCSVFVSPTIPHERSFDRLTLHICRSVFLNELLITTQWAPILWWFTVTCVSCAKPHISFGTSVWISQNHLFCTWFSKIRNYHDLFFAIGLTTCFLALNFV